MILTSVGICFDKNESIELPLKTSEARNSHHLPVPGTVVASLLNNDVTQEPMPETHC